MRQTVEESIDLWVQTQLDNAEDLAIMFSLGYGATMMARAIDDQPSCRCRLCNLHPGYIYDADGNKKTCPVCKGTGRIDWKKQNAKHSPSFIHAQGPRSSKDDWRSDIIAIVDQAYCGMTESQQIVFYHEHVPRPGKKRKKLQSDRAAEVGLSPSRYSALLKSATELVEGALSVPV